MSTSMKKAIKTLNSVADVGFNLKNPEDREKRSQLIQGLFMNKYDRAKLAQKETENVEEKHEG